MRGYLRGKLYTLHYMLLFAIFAMASGAPILVVAYAFISRATAKS